MSTYSYAEATALLDRAEERLDAHSLKALEGLVVHEPNAVAQEVVRLCWRARRALANSAVHAMGGSRNPRFATCMG